MIGVGVTVGVGLATGVAIRGADVGWGVFVGVAFSAIGVVSTVAAISGVGVINLPQPVNKQPTNNHIVRLIQAKAERVELNRLTKNSFYILRKIRQHCTTTQPWE